MIELHPEHARAVLAELLVGVVMLDRRDRVVWLNAHATRLLEVALEDIMGRKVESLPIPYAVPAPPGEPQRINVRGALVGTTQYYSHANGSGTVVTFYERDHAFASHLAALVSGAATSGILNAAAIKARLEGEVSRSRRYANPLSCLTVWLPAGATTCDPGALAHALKEQLRWVDLLGCWAEDILLVILPETAEQAAASLTDKLRDVAATGAATASLEIGHTAWRRGDNAERMVRRALASGRASIGPARRSGRRD
ncbi:MAG: hypothetical protein WD928_08115 [Gammaproteobacteria bacterium]